MSYSITGLDPTEFAPLFALTEEELRARGIVRRTVDDRPVFPCRVSLEDTPSGEDVLLLNYMHLDVASPYRASHAIYVREGVAQAEYRDEIPDVMRRRTVSLRAFDANGMLQDADLAEGDAIDAVVRRLLSRPGVAHVDIHYAKPGCFAGRAVPA